MQPLIIVEPFWVCARQTLTSQPNALTPPVKAMLRLTCAAAVQQQRHERRWHPRMDSPVLHLEHWRKSSQWFAISRAHAQLMIDDGPVDDIFRKDCYPTQEDGWWGPPVQGSGSRGWSFGAAHVCKRRCMPARPAVCLQQYHGYDGAGACRGGRSCCFKECCPV